MANGIQVRAMVPADAAQVAALVGRAFSAQPVVLDPAPSALNVRAEDIAAHLQEGAGAVAEDMVLPRELLGAVLWVRREDGLYVSRLAVDPAFRRRGIARQLLVAAEREGRRLGAERLSLGTRLALMGNRALFAGCGFREIAYHAHPGYPAPTWVQMEKQLG